MLKNEVILVDENDNPVGTEEKLKAHQQGKLHRAFSIFIFNSKGELLLQKRAKEKYHSGGLWTNTCCSHPGPGQELEKEAQKRLQEEMGFTCDMKEISSFLYKADLGNLIEHEFDHVFLGEFNGDPKPNKEEAEDWKWISLKDLNQDIKKHPEEYTEWFKIILKAKPPLIQGFML